jgi:hypothetical protein
VTGGNGGNGYTYSVFGITFGGGGGGGAQSNTGGAIAGAGGIGGGGGGALQCNTLQISTGTNGTTNLGGGGGGAAGGGQGGNGGSGIVILRISNSYYSGSFTGNPQVSPGASVVTLTYNQSGTYRA